MRFFLYIKDAWKTILANKMRSGLSTLGIIIGMASVIIMMSLGEGYKSVMLQQVGDIMKNKITIYPGGGYSDYDYENDKPGGYIKKIEFTSDLITYIEHYFPDLKGKISYNNQGSSEFRKNGKTNYISYNAVPSNRFNLEERKIEQGTFFTKRNYQAMDFVALVNRKFVEEYFKGKSPLGQKIRIEQRDFTVIGVLKPTSDEGRWSQATAYIPSTTYFERIKHDQKLSNLVVYLSTEEDNVVWKNRLTYLLLKKFNQTNASSAGFNVQSFAEFSQQIKKISTGITSFLLVIGLISLIVGGIGVMNIMIVSVTERTREIGIRKAIGALNTDITFQFLVESIVITFIGGILAFILSYIGIGFINKVFSGGAMEGMKAVINFQVVWLAFLLTTFTGVLFGILPARKAAKLKPIDALRFE